MVHICDSPKNSDDFFSTYAYIMNYSTNFSSQQTHKYYNSMYKPLTALNFISSNQFNQKKRCVMTHYIDIVD